MFFYIVLFFCVILLVLIICFLFAYNNYQTFQKTEFGEMFSSLVFRPIDIINHNYYKTMDLGRAIKNIQIYGNQIVEGYKFMKNKKIVVCGLLYNAESQIKYLENWFNELKLLCKSCVFVIVENNSKDATRKLLIEWKKNDPLQIHLVCLNTDYCDSDINKMSVNTSSPDPSRIRKMAFLRNCYVKYVQENFTDFDYVFVKDLDLQGHLFWDGIFHSFFYLKTHSKLDVLTCNGIMRKGLRYYDTFAYAKDNFETSWNFGWDKRNHDHDVREYVSAYYQKNMDLDKVASAFGGFAIYKMDQFMDKFYSFDRNRLTCEHSLYHMLYENVHVNPRMIFLIEANKT